MNRILFIALCISIVMSTVACQKEYDGEYVRWGDTLDSDNLYKLERNNIPFKVEDNKVFIPEDALNKATYCCT